MKRALILTVGSSHIPILVALASNTWDRVVFVVSDDDAITSAKGSWPMVEGKGNVCKSSRDVKSPDLPAIPAQAKLDDACWRDHVLRVPADDITTGVNRCLDALRDLSHQGYTVVGDYTGGTKSMTAALAIAVQLTEGAKLQVVTGPRHDLQATTGDLSRVQLVQDALRDPLLFKAARRAWRAYDYAAAANLLHESTSPTARRLEALSLGYAAWSNLDYEDANQRLSCFTQFVPSEHLRALGGLCGDDPKHREAVRLHDLSLLAERHAAVGRYDMAILVLYRTLEGIAQWALRHEHDVDTSDVPEGSPFAELAHSNHSGQLVLGLDAAWSALEAHDRGPLGAAMKGQVEKRRGISRMRNESVLAHGDRRLGQADWQRFHGWFSETIQPAFRSVAYNKRTPHPQLPRTLPE